MDESTQIIRDLHRHSSWANRQLLNTAARLSQEQLRTPIGAGGIGNLLETLLHMYDAQESWFDRCRTGTSGPALDIADFRDIATLQAAWDRLDSAMDDYIAGLDAQSLAEPVSYRSFYGSEGTYPRREMLLHQAFHSHQHRGEVALILTQLGHSPGEIDFIDYILTR